MKLPRSLSGKRLVQALTRLGYVAIRQTGSHRRLKTTTGDGHEITVPMHKRLKPGTLNGILKDVGEHAGMSREELLQKLFD